MKRFQVLGICIIIILLSVLGTTASASDLEGKSRTYTYKNSVDLSSEDGSFSDSISNEYKIEVEFAESSENSGIDVLFVIELDDYVYWVYTSGGYYIDEMSMEETIRYIDPVTLSVGETRDLVIDEFIFIVIADIIVYDTELFLIDLENRYTDDSAYSNIELGETSISADYNREDVVSSLVTADRTVDISGSVEMDYDSDGLLQNYHYEVEFSTNGFTIIDYEIHIRSGLDRFVNNLLTSIWFWIIFSIIAIYVGLTYRSNQISKRNNMRQENSEEE